jgi:nicotinamide-nucleotide amidase
MGVTGIAGPEGGSDEKPVGLVCFAVATRQGAETVLSARLPGGRADIRDRSTTVALHLLRRLLRGEAETELPGVPGGAADPASAQSG